MKHLTEDFESRFRLGDTPWEDPLPWPGLEALFARFARPGARVLDLGCGLGTNSLALARLGYEVLGVDISPTAIAGARARLDGGAPECTFRVADLFTEDCGMHDVVFDRGCLHGFIGLTPRRRFADGVHRSLVAGGLWIDVSGSVENGDPPDRVREDGLPRLTLLELVQATEPAFEALEITQAQYGTGENTDFRAWIAVFRRRDRVS